MGDMARIRGWCPGALRPMQSGDGLIVRLRLTGGILPMALAADIARCLKPGGLFLFTTEASTAKEYELGPKRRWRHSERYIRHAASLVGFDVAGLLECSPRNEAGVPVAGFAVALTKQ